MSPRITKTNRAGTVDEQLPADVAAELAELEAALRGEPGTSDELGALVREVRALAPELDSEAGKALDGLVEARFGGGAKAGAGKTSAARQAASPLRRIFTSFSDAWRRAPMAVATVAVFAIVVAGGAFSALQSSGDGYQQQQAVTVDGGEPPASAPQVDELAGSGSRASADAAAPNAYSREASPDASALLNSTEQLTPTSGGSSVPGGLSASSAAPGAGGSSQRAVRRSVDMTVRVDGLSDAAAEVAEITGRVDGFVSGSEVNLREGDTGNGFFTLRIPSAKLDEATAELGKLGVVTDQRRSSEDITSDLNSAKGRLDDAKAERKALLRSLSKAGTTGEIASLRARIADNRRAQARLDAQVKRVQRQATTSTVQLTLTTNRDGEVIERDRDGIGGALDDAVDILEGIAGALIIGLAVIAPFALIAAIGVAIARRRRRARHRSALGDE